MIDEYVKRRVQGQLKTALEIERRLKRALASLLDRPAADVRRRDIRVVLDTVADAGHSREAEKRRQCIGAMWKWAIGADIVETNAAANLPRYNGGTPRDRVLTADEMVSFWQWLPESRIPAAHADVLRLELLLGARCGEIAGMQANEIDQVQRIWMLPAERSKNGDARATPLVGRAWEIISRRLACKAQGPVFPTDIDKPLTASHVGQMLLTHPLPIAKFVTHDLRRTVASGLVDLGITMEITAAVLGHAVGGAKLATLRRHYVRTDYIKPKRRALEAWSQRIEGLISGSTESASVVPFAPPRAEGPEAAA
jgi:integrase